MTQMGKYISTAKKNSVEQEEVVGAKAETWKASL